MARNVEAARRVTTLPGIGVLNVTALIAAFDQARPLPESGFGCLASDRSRLAEDGCAA